MCVRTYFSTISPIILRVSLIKRSTVSAREYLFRTPSKVSTESSCPLSLPLSLHKHTPISCVATHSFFLLISRVFSQKHFHNKKQNWSNRDLGYIFSPPLGHLDCTGNVGICNNFLDTWRSLHGDIMGLHWTAPSSTKSKNIFHFINTSTTFLI